MSVLALFLALASMALIPISLFSQLMACSINHIHFGTVKPLRLKSSNKTSANRGGFVDCAVISMPRLSPG